MENEHKDNQEETKNTGKPKKVKPPKRQKLAKLFLSIVIISSIAMFCFALFIPASGFFGALIYILWFLIVFIISVMTIGFIWLNEGFKRFTGGLLNFGTEVINNSTSTFLMMKPYFPIIASITGAIVILSLVFLILWFKKPKENEKHNKGRMITGIVFASIYIICLVIGIFMTINVK